MSAPDQRLLSPQRFANNFDLIRLLAASQVLQSHAASELHLPSPPLLAFVLDQIPGVPIFFLVSGYLIALSLLQGDGGVGTYFARRALRIYPALWVNVGLILAALVVTGSLSPLITPQRLGTWLATCLLFGNDIYPSFVFGRIVDPDAFYGFFPSGVLWTIPVELGFYALLPLILSRRERGQSAAGWLLLGLGLASLGLAVLLQFLKGARPDALLTKILMVTTPAYLWYFLIGTACALYWGRLRNLFEGRLALWLIVHFGLAIAVWLGSGQSAIDFHEMTPFLPIQVLSLAGVVFSFAFTFLTLTSRLRGTDISFGIYLYHAPIIWTLAALHAPNDGRLWAVILSLSVLFALLSWFAIERPALRMKAVTDILLASKASKPP